MILVIGGTSFIGMYTIDELVRNGKQVLATGRNRKLEPMVRSLGADYVELDITDEDDFSKLPTSGVEGVILLAALLPANAKADLVDEENAADYFRVNCIGTVNVLEYCRKHGIKKDISYCSYGDT